jgi:hypothetical protein
MLSFLARDLPAVGRVYYPGSIPPPIEPLKAFTHPASWTPLNPTPDQVWAARVAHPAWGTADLSASRPSEPVPGLLIDHTLLLSDEEKRRARRGQAAIDIRLTARHGHMLRDRKRLLHWMRALMRPDGAIACDLGSTLFWSHGMLDDELAHDADLDIQALYTIHAVYDPNEDNRVSWLHTHGLEELGAFDVDILSPSPLLADICADPIRALAFAAIEGRITPSTSRFRLAEPGGAVRLVPVERFHRDAAIEHQRLRDTDQVHLGRRAVLCEPARGLFGFLKAQLRPSRFLSEMTDQNWVVPFSPAATALMAERARKTIDVFEQLRQEFDSVKLTSGVKLGYEVEGGGPDNCEHLWFEVHRMAGDRIDATLLNAPHRVPQLTAGQRGSHDVGRLTDWIIMTPEGAITPRHFGAARRLRATRQEWEAQEPSV